MAQNARPSEAPVIGDDDLVVLSQLTDKQTAFVVALLEGKGSSEAYRAAFNAENMSDAAVAVEAARLRHSPKVALAVSLLRLASMAGQAIRTREQYVAETEALKEGALRAGQWTAARGFHEIVGKVEGHLVERIKDETDRPNDALREAVVDRLSALFGQDSKPLRARLGVRH